MGIANSKDDRGVRVLQALPPGFLDDKGKELRNNLDYCLEKNGWYFTIAGLALSIPICFKFKTERPFYVAAILSPMADMYYGTLRCTKENEAFAQHYRYLHKRYHTPAWKQGDIEELEQQYEQQQQQSQSQQQGNLQQQPQRQQAGADVVQQQQQQQQSGDKEQQWQPHVGDPPQQQGQESVRRWWSRR